MYIIFTGANYFQVNSLPKIKGDLQIIQGYRWVKSRKKFTGKEQMFACPKHYQVLTDDEAKVQGLK